MNKVILSGRLTKDPEERYTQAGSLVASFTLAVQRYVKDGDNQTDYIRCVAYGNIGKAIIERFKKGKTLTLFGDIKTGSYEKNGQKVYTTDVIVKEIVFPDKEQEPSGSYEQMGSGAFEVVEADGDMPF